VVQQGSSVLRGLGQDLAGHAHAPLAEAGQQAEQQPLLVLAQRKAGQALARQTGQSPEMF